MADEAIRDALEARAAERPKPDAAGPPMYTEITPTQVAKLRKTHSHLSVVHLGRFIHYKQRGGPWMRVYLEDLTSAFSPLARLSMDARFAALFLAAWQIYHEQTTFDDNAAAVGLMLMLPRTAANTRNVQRIIDELLCSGWLALVKPDGA